MSMTRVLLVAVLVMAALPAMAVTVENYSWMQLSPRYTGSFVGSGDNVWTLGYSGYGTIEGIRSRTFVWIPHPDMTDARNGTVASPVTGDMYWAAIQLDQPRLIEKVDVQLWAQNNETSVKAFYVDASLDGTTWTQVGSYNYGSPQHFEVSPVATVALASPAEYQYVRVRFEPGDYHAMVPNYGGPGVLMINPIGSGELADEKVNWANRTFGTTIKASFYATDYSVTGHIVNENGVRRLIDGNPAEYNDDNYRAGVNTNLFGNANPAMWFELDLGQSRVIDEVVALWQAGNYGDGFTVQYSTDGDTFHAVKNPSKIIVGAALTTYTFDPVEAQYWRITELTGNQWCLFEQVMMYGPAVPEPMALSLLTIGGLAMLRRRR